MGYVCPVCGFPDLQDPPSSSRARGGSYEICPSCGFEFGVTDDDLGFTYDQWRQRWIGRGMPWESAASGPRLKNGIRSQQLLPVASSCGGRRQLAVLMSATYRRP